MPYICVLWIEDSVMIYRARQLYQKDLKGLKIGRKWDLGLASMPHQKASIQLKWHPAHSGDWQTSWLRKKLQRKIHVQVCLWSWKKCFYSSSFHSRMHKSLKCSPAMWLRGLSCTPESVSLLNQLITEELLVCAFLAQYYLNNRHLQIQWMLFRWS